MIHGIKTNSTNKITIFIKNVNGKLGLIIRKNWSYEEDLPLLPLKVEEVGNEPRTVDIRCGWEWPSADCQEGKRSWFCKCGN